MRTLARSAALGLALLLAALVAAPAAPAATVASFSFPGEPASAASYSFNAGGTGLTVTGLVQAGNVPTAAPVTRGAHGLGVLAGAGAPGLSENGRRQSLVFSFETAVSLGTLRLAEPGAGGRIVLHLDGERHATVPFGRSRELAYGFPAGTSGQTLRVETSGAASGFDVSALTLVAPVPPALPLMLGALAGLMLLRARGRRSMRTGR